MRTHVKRLLLLLLKAKSVHVSYSKNQGNRIFPQKTNIKALWKMFRRKVKLQYRLEISEMLLIVGGYMYIKYAANSPI